MADLVLADWPIIIDSSVMEKDIVVVGGGLRGSKMALNTGVFKSVTNAEILDIKKR